MRTSGGVHRGLRTAVLTAAVLSMMVLPAAAQLNTGTIELRFVDQSGAALPGTTTVVRNSETGATRTAVAAANGISVFQALPPGNYVVEARLDGFATVRQEGLNLLVGQTVRLDVSMQVEVSETITVTAEAPIVDVFKSDVSSNITPEQIEQLPVADRDFEKLAFIAPGVQRERGGFRFITNAPVLGSGSNASQSTIVVDGADFTDQALGMSRARFSQDAVREFRVVTNRFDTEFGNSAGGALSIVTKSGTNEVHGSTFGFYRGDSLRSQGELEQGTQDFSRYQVGATVGGPIIPDKAHYFLSFEYVDESNITLFRPQGAFASLAEDLDHPFDQLLGLASVNYQAADSHALEFKAVYDRYREENFRVGGVCDESCGMQLNRDNWNMLGSHTWMISDTSLNEARLQFGRKEFDEPNNSDEMAQNFSLGTTLVSGANIVGDQNMTGDYIELRDTYHRFAGDHDLKLGFSAQFINEDWYYPVFPQGALYWASDAGLFPFLYYYGDGPPDTEVSTDLYGLFVQDDWRLSPAFSLSLGLRYDYDSDGNNPDFTHPESPAKRSVDDDNIQPRIGFAWDISGDGSSVLRGGAGLFTGRYLLVPSFVELQQNGISGRTIMTRISLFDFGIIIDPNDPENTGFPLPPNIALLESSLEAPETFQASLGYTRRLGETGLYLDLEGVYADGDNEIIIRDVNFNSIADGGGRPNPAYTMINMYTNEGHSEYKSVIASVNGVIEGGHLITASVTWSDKKNISDDFSPQANNYPADPADMENEYGRSRGDEEWRMVLSGIFKLPWDFSIAPVYFYGSGQPWNRRMGYDYNGDLRYGDRLPGVDRNSEDGPRYSQFNLRLTKTFRFAAGNLDLIAEAFNLFNTTNYNVESVDGAEFFAGPTLANPSLAYVENPNFGNYSATLDPREIQVGVRYRF